MTARIFRALFLIYLAGMFVLIGWGALKLIPRLIGG